MGDLNLKAASGGQIVLTPTNTASNYTLTLPAATGNIITSADTGTVTQTMLGTNVAGNGPAFYVYNSSGTTLASGASTKIAFQTAVYNIGSFFDTATNYRFQPTVAGYYQFNASVRTDTSCAYLGLYLTRNGTNYSGGNFTAASSTGPVQSTLSTLVYLDGSTHYVEMTAFVAGTVTTATGQLGTWWNGFLARSA